MKNNEFTTKNDFLFFKDEILGDLKNVEVKYNERFNQISSYLETQKNFNDKKHRDLITMIGKLTKKIEEKTDFDKLEEKLKQSLKSMQDMSVKLEIKFNILDKELKDACFKYDKIFSNNLMVPGVVGIGCPYENMRYFIEFANLKLAELIKGKEKQSLDNKAYKDKIEGIIKQNQFQFETMQVKFSDIIAQEIKKNDNMCKERISSVYAKIEKDKVDYNNILDEFKLNLDKFGNDFYRFYKDDWTNQFNLVNNINDKLGKDEDELLIYNMRLKELEELVKKINTNRRRTSILNNLKDNTDRNLNNVETMLTNQKNKRISIKKLDIQKVINNNTSKDNDSNRQRSNRKKTTIIKNKDDKNNNNTTNKLEELGISIIKRKVKNKDKASNSQTKEDNNSELVINSKSRNEKNNVDKKPNINNNNNKSEYNDDNNNKNGIGKKLDFKSLNIQKRTFKNNINENNKAHDNNNEINEKRDNNNKFFKVINYKDVFNNNRNNLNNNKTTKSIEIGSNFDYNTIDFRNKYNINASEKIRLNNYAIGGDFSENDLHFINNAKYNLSQAYFMAKIRLEEQQKLKRSNIFSSMSLNSHNSFKNLGKNKFNFNPKYYHFKRNKLKERDITPDRYPNFHSTFHDINQEVFNSNFPSIYKNPQNVPEIQDMEQRTMYLSYLKDNIIERKNEINSNANKTQIDYNLNYENEKKMLNIIKKDKKRKKIGLVGSSSDVNLPIKMESFTPNNISNPYLNRSNNDERLNDLSFDNGGAKATLKRVKSFLIKKFKEDFI